MSTLASNVPTSVSMTPLERVISQVESNGNFMAMRFERRCFNKITDQGSTPIINKIQSINHCSSDTARVIYSTSWGAFQIMGFNLYNASGLKISVGEFLNSPYVQIAEFNRYCENRNIVMSVDALKNNQSMLDTFAVKYNGSTEYGKRVKQIIKELGL